MRFSSNHSSLVLSVACVIFGNAFFPTKVHSFVTKEKLSVPLNNKKITTDSNTVNVNKDLTIQHAIPPLGQYAPAAAALFGNMITPASILGGAIIPMSFASGLDFTGDEGESKFAKCKFVNKK